MAQHVNSDSDDDFHSLSQQGGAEPDDASDSASMDIVDMAPPVHPIPAFQAAFEESIVEAAEDTGSPDPDSDLECDAEMRRRRLLEADNYDDIRVSRWKHTPAAKYHPFVKLMAQIVFGMHLLQQEQAKSDEAVVKILQNHVNDVDNFLERTSDDFDLAIVDIEERIRYLQLPMQHMDIFEVMLDEKKFRSDLLYGNEKIEKIIGRTGKAMQDAMLDIQSGIKCTQELHGYLATIERAGPIAKKEIAEVFSAMRGNQQGWMKFLLDLQTKGNNLSNELVNLGNVIAEISRLAGEASRRNKPHVQQRSSSSPQGPSNRSSVLQSKYTKNHVVYQKPGAWLDKPLPREPGTSGNTIEVAMPKPHPVPFATRFEQPRRRAPVPGSRNSSSPLSGSPAPQRPRTSSSADPRTAGRDNAPGLPREHSNPLRSHPPDDTGSFLHSSPLRKPGRTQSQGAGDILNATAKGEPTMLSKRSKSSGNVAGTMSPIEHTSKKTVGFSQKLSGSTRVNFVPKRAATGDHLPSISNGFSRRLSLKLRNNKPPPVISIPKREPQILAKPVDSAYSSDRKRSTSSPTNFTADTDEKTEPEKDIPPLDLEKSGPDVTSDKDEDLTKFSLARDGSRLALFPKVSTPTGQQSKSVSPSPNSKAWEDAFESSPRPKTREGTKTSRAFSITRLLHRRAESKNTQTLRNWSSGGVPAQ